MRSGWMAFPFEEVQQGYSYTESPDGKALTSITQVKKGMQ